ncbi:12948_t:CDS:2 [Funneliformis caledonium]|uniref:12948_t:CDS:1 n=1 Tax=Funneliformis caledonium TaxID=1117310 RepID=A0A9N8VTY9_9GLOM|nr:12948_t:CDS:2 [Funneliformis caledonium]
MTTYETDNAEQVYNNNVYDDDEMDNSSETSKGYTSSNSSFVDESKKNDGLIVVEDNKVEKKTKRSTSNSFKRMFNSKKDDKEDKDKEKPQSEGLVRSLSSLGLFGKDKSEKSEKGEKFLRPTSRTSSNSDKKKRRSFIFFSDNEDDNNKLDVDFNFMKGRKSRQNSNSDAEKEKSSKKENRLSLNLGKILGLDGNKPSHKPNIWDDTFLEPGETVGTPISPTRNHFQNGSSPTSLRNKQFSNFMDSSSYVDSPVDSLRDNLSGPNNVNIPNPISKIDDIPSKNRNNNSEVTSDESPDYKSPSDDVRSTNSSSSTVPSSVTDQEDYKEIPSYNNISGNQRKTEFSGENISYDYPHPISEGIEEIEESESEQNSPTTPITPRLIVTGSGQHESEFTEVFNDSNNQKQVSFEEKSDDTKKLEQQSLVNSTVGSKPNSDRLARMSEIKTSMNVKPLVISSVNVIHDTTHVKHITPDVQAREMDTDSTTANIVEKRNQDNTTITSAVTAQVYDKDQVEKKSSNKKPFLLSNLNPFQDKSIKENNSHEQVLKKLKELEETNRSLTDAKTNLETRVAEQSGQISKLNSMDQIMQQQFDVSKRMTETMLRLESKVNQQKEELDSTNVGKLFEDTIKRLEDKIDQQNEELNYLKSIVGQLAGGNPQLYITNGEDSQMTLTPSRESLQIRSHEDQHQSRRETYTKLTLVNTLVVNPLYNTITVSASIATSVLYAVYVRPVVGLVKVVRNGAAGFQ